MAGLFRDLRPNEVEARVAQCSAKGASLLLYKTARTDYALLDETVGPERWGCDYREVKGSLFCKISILFDGKVISKENCGTESNMEAQKGEASDAMKRAGFAWGIGRELYTAPFIWVPADKLQKLSQNQRTNKWQCLDRFEVTDMTVANGEIVWLAISHEGKRDMVYRYGGIKKDQEPPRDPLPTKDQMTTLLDLAKTFGDAKHKSTREVLEALYETPTMRKSGTTAKTQTLTDAQAQVALMVLRNWCKHI
jgi:hypothetical protein|nr:MAG TPA: hypothetical protein [Caudoviricetes sp.]